MAAALTPGMPLSEAVSPSLRQETTVVTFFTANPALPRLGWTIRRALRLANAANPPTLRLLGRILIASGRACGYIQLAHQPPDTPAQEALAVLKTAALATGNYLTAKAATSTVAGAVQITFKDAAAKALANIELYDPALIFLDRQIALDGTVTVFVRQSGTAQGVWTLDLGNEMRHMLEGLGFPVESR